MSRSKRLVVDFRAVARSQTEARRILDRAARRLLAERIERKDGRAER